MQPDQDYFSMQMESIFEDLEQSDGEEDLATLQEPDIAQYEDDLFKAESRTQELVNIQEMLIESNGVSRGMAENFKDILPDTIALESFTGQVTRTNHAMSLEFIGTAIALAATAGVVAVLGSVGYLVYKIVKFKRSLPNLQMDKQVTAMVNSVEDKLRSAITELRSLFPDINHQDLSWKREDGLIQAAIANHCQEIDILMLSGKYKSLASGIGMSATEQSRAIEKFFKEGIFPELDKLVKAGTGKDVENVSQKLQEYQLTNLVSPHLLQFGRELHLKFDNPEQVCAKFRESYTGPISANDLPARLRTISLSTATLDDKDVRTLFKAQGIMLSLADRIQQYERRMDKSKELPGEYLAEVKGLLQQCKAPLESMADVFTIVEIEVASQKRSAKIKAGAVANGFKSVSEFYQEQAKVDKAGSKDYKSCATHLKRLFDPIAAALR